MRVRVFTWVVPALVVFPVWAIWVAAPAWSYAFVFVGGLLIFERKELREFRWWRQGARGEEAVARELSALEGSGYRALHDLDVGRGNVDHVVVGPTGVFVLETKAWRGRVFFGRGGRLMCNGHDRRAARDQALRNVMLVRERLRERGIAGWVTGVIVLTATDLPKGPMNLKHVSVITKADLRRVLTSGHARLDEHGVRRALTAVATLRKDGPYKQVA